MTRRTSILWGAAMVAACAAAVLFHVSGDGNEDMRYAWYALAVAGIFAVHGTICLFCASEKRDESNGTDRRLK